MDDWMRVNEGATSREDFRSSYEFRLQLAAGLIAYGIRVKAVDTFLPRVLDSSFFISQGVDLSSPPKLKNA